MLCSDWLSHSTLAIIGYIFTCENAIGEVDWTNPFFTCENIAHVEFYLQGLLPKILAISTIKQYMARLEEDIEMSPYP